MKTIKWPKDFDLIRHDTSGYNVVGVKKKSDPLYKEFLIAFEKDPESREAVALALAVQKKYALGIGDSETPLADKDGNQAFQVGRHFSRTRETVPDVIHVSPYLRTRETLRHLTRGWPALEVVPIYEEERVREQEHGLSLIYNDWRVFHVMHPDQRRLRALQGPYWYRYPQGENVPDVRDRVRSYMTTIVREFAGKRVLVITHHLTILSIRANQERWDALKFIDCDENNKPINCGVTTYRGEHGGSNGRLVLKDYNQKHYI